MKKITPLPGLLVLILGACEAEKRPLGVSDPITAPTGPADPREARYQGSAYQISQGGRLFGWYGCTPCHGGEAQGARKLDDDDWRYGGDIAAVYTSIAQGRPGGMPAYGASVPIESIWQLAAYVRDLHKIPAEKRRRQDMDAAGEPQADWKGAVR